mgnify:CR=1 FL=1
MTEQEIKQKINDCDRQIVSAYNNLRSAARDVGSRGYQAAQSARQSAISEASGNKTKNTLLPLIISVVGYFMFGVSWFLGLVMLIGGIVLAYNLNQKADKELKSVQSSYNQMVSVAENQQRNLNSTLDNNTKI